MEFDNLYDEYQMKKMRKIKGGVLGIRNFGVVDYFRGNRDNPDNHDNYNPSTPEDLRRDLEKDRERRRRRVIDAEGFEMIGADEIDNATMGNLQRQDGIEMRGQGASGGLIPFMGMSTLKNPMSMMNPQMLANFMPMPSALRGLVGNGASGGFIPMMLAAAHMAGLNPMKMAGLIGMGKNRKDILYYPKDEVSGGFFNPMSLMSMASMAPSLLKNLPLGAIFGKGKNNLQFLPNPELIEKISLKGVKGGSFMDSLNNIAHSVVNNPVVKNEAQKALNRFNQSNMGQDLAEARRIRTSKGGFLDGNAIVGAMKSGNTAKSLGARLALGQFMPSVMSNPLLGLIGLGKNKVIYYPHDEVRGGMFTIKNLFDIATMAPSFLKDTPLGGIFGKGKDDFEFMLNPELMKKFEKKGVKGGAFMDAVNSITRTIMTDPGLRNEINKFRRTDTGRNVFNTSRDILNTGLDLVEANKIRKARGGNFQKYLKEFGSGFLMVQKPFTSATSMASMLPIPGAQLLKPVATLNNVANSAIGYLTGNGSTGGADPREYRRPSVTARPELLQMANMRGIETSQAKGDAGGAYGGYVHRPSSYHGSGQNLYAGSMDMKRTVGCGGGAARSERAAIVKQVMNERGVSMIEASRIVKNENMY